MKKNNLIDITTLFIFSFSLYLKLNNLNLVEYKFDQQFGFSVLSSCSENSYFSYINGSTGLPQGALHYIFECFAGVVGINDFINLVRFEILISQISLFFIYILISKNINKFIASCSISLVLLNPYLIVATRNISSAEHYEFFMLIYLYLFFNFMKIRNGKLLLGLYSSMTLIVYFPLFIFFTTFLLVINFKDKQKDLKKYISGYTIGLLINFLSYLPYIFENGIPTTRNTTSSWGLSSYWRIFLDIFSSSSLMSKINNPNDLNNLISEFSYFQKLLIVNRFVLFILFIFFILKYSQQLYKGSSKIDVDLITFTSLTFSGIVFTFLDRPLYAHYFFTIIIFGYISIFKFIEKKILVLTVCLILNISNIFLYTNFISFVESNNGIKNSDYGTVYIKCGCCVEDARICRGQ